MPITTVVFPCRTDRRASFTFLEVLIAVAILGLSLAMVLSILGGARSRILRAERRWANQHLLTQAAELYLLGGPDVKNIPEGLLPENFSIRCDVEPVDDLPLAAQAPLSGWLLGRYRITVTGRGGEVVSEAAIEKLMRQETLQ